MSLRAGIRRTSSKVRPSLANLSSRVNPPPSPGEVYRLKRSDERRRREERRPSPERVSSAEPRAERFSRGTTSELVALLRELLSKGRSAPGPGLGYRDAPPAP